MLDCFTVRLTSLMQIREIHIHNYRSIADEHVSLRDYSLLIGANNSGKSNLIDAIRTFYDKDLKFEADRDLPKFTLRDDESWIEVEYQLSSHEASTIKTEYLVGRNRCRIRKWLYPQDKAKLGLLGYENEQLSQNMFYGWKNVGQAKLGSVIYVPAISRLDEHTKLSGPSALRDLVNDILRSIIKSSAAYVEMRNHFKTFEASVKREETPDKRSLEGLEIRINDEIREWGAKFNFEVVSPEIEDIIKSLIKHSIVDSSLDVPLESSSFGHGFQRHLIFALIRTSASYTLPDAEPKKKEFSPDFQLLLFEEPEAFLHPQQQDVLDASLRKLAHLQGRQVLAATHSPNFVSYNTDDIADLVRLCRTEGRTCVYQISQKDLNAIFETNLAARDIVETARDLPDGGDTGNQSDLAIEEVRHFLWLNPERSSLFFADSVLVVEGLSEQVLVNYLIRKGEINVPTKWVFVLETWGKYNIHRFMNLLGALRIKHAVLYDLDDTKQGPEKVKHERLASLIEQSRNDSTLGIESIPSNLETFLGIEIEEGERWKKAAKILLLTMEGKIKAELLSTFKSKIEKLLARAPA
jgi:putative ATP-dependent endonuclease of the OLD family